MTTTYVDNILAVLDRATPTEITSGLYWYHAANALAWELDHVSHHRGAGVIAALSPRLRWEKNVDYARLAYNLKGYSINEVENYIPTLKNSRRKALAMVNGAHPKTVMGNGLKTNAFYHNIAHPWDSNRVTVDKHAFDIAMGERTGYSTVITDKNYRIIEKAYVEAAFVSGYAPLQVQAIAWVRWRNEHQ